MGGKFKAPAGSRCFAEEQHLRLSLPSHVCLFIPSPPTPQKTLLHPLVSSFDRLFHPSLCFISHPLLSPSPPLYLLSAPLLLSAPVFNISFCGPTGFSADPPPVSRPSTRLCISIQLFHYSRRPFKSDRH